MPHHPRRLVAHRPGLHRTATILDTHTDARNGSQDELRYTIAALAAVLCIAVPVALAQEPIALVGSDGPDVLNGTAGEDAIYGRGGNDLLNGLDGDDELDGGSGGDALLGGAGKDAVAYAGAVGVAVTIDGAADDGLPGEGDNVAAEEIVAVRREAPGRSSRLVLFAREHVVVTQQAIAERAILRLTAYPRPRLAGLARELLRLGEAVAFADAEPIVTTVPDLDRAERSAHGDGGGLGAVEPRLLDVMYARRATCELSVTRQAGGRLERATIRWIDAGTVGLWELVTEPDSHDVSLRPLDPAAALRDLGLGLAEPA